jgi:hypothetical protein
MPTFGLEILRCEGDPRDETEVVDAIGLDAIHSADEWVASDDVKRGALDPERVMDARAKELQYLRDHGVYEYVTVAEAKATSGKPPLRLKWIDSNKGDSEHPNYRSRLVCTEVRRKGMTPIFSATPPLEAIRVLVAKVSSEEPSTTKDPLKAMLVDVSRAHFYAPAVRDVFVELQREDPRSGDGVTCGRLLKTMYGALDAAEQWGLHYTQTLVDAGFIHGRASPCHFVHPRLGIWVVVHGDDFLVVARGAGRRYFEKIIRAVHEVKVSIAGPEPDAKELRALGRMLTYRADGLALEADPRLHESVIRRLGPAGAKSVSTPGCYPRGGSAGANLRERRIRAKPVEEEDSDAEDVPLAEPRLTHPSSCGPLSLGPAADYGRHLCRLGFRGLCRHPEEYGGRRGDGGWQAHQDVEQDDGHHRAELRRS